MAPHLILITASILGAIGGLMAWRQCSLAEALGYVAAWATVAWLFAGAAASLAAQHIPGGAEPRDLLAVVGMLIAYIGHRWPALLRRVGALLLAVVTQKVRQ